MAKFAPGQKKIGGRKPGSLNKATKARQLAIIQAASTGLTPLDYMLDILRNPDATEEDRKWAAANAAPYMHAKLSSVEAKVDAEVVTEVRDTIVDQRTRP
jgi:hypothetical protein